MQKWQAVSGRDAIPLLGIPVAEANNPPVAMPAPNFAWKPAASSDSLFTGLMFLWDLLDTFNEAAGQPAAFFVGNGWKRSRVTNH
jgi:hypothetical protein